MLTCAGISVLSRQTCRATVVTAVHGRNSASRSAPTISWHWPIRWSSTGLLPAAIRWEALLHKSYGGGIQTGSAGSFFVPRPATSLDLPLSAYRSVNLPSVRRAGEHPQNQPLRLAQISSAVDMANMTARMNASRIHSV
jgi:hypothetical protein